MSYDLQGTVKTQGRKSSQRRTTPNEDKYQQLQRPASAEALDVAPAAMGKDCALSRKTTTRLVADTPNQHPFAASEFLFGGAP
jgi:hypothetical protein